LIDLLAHATLAPYPTQSYGVVVALLREPIWSC